MAKNLARVRLEYPIPIGRNREITELKIRPATRADAAMVGFNLDAPSDEAVIRLLAHLAGVTRHIIEDLDPRDFQKVAETIKAGLPVAGNA